MQVLFATTICSSRVMFHLKTRTALLRFPNWTAHFLTTVCYGLWDAFSLIWWVCHSCYLISSDMNVNTTVLKRNCSAVRLRTQQGAHLAVFSYQPETNFFRFWTSLFLEQTFRTVHKLGAWDGTGPVPCWWKKRPNREFNQEPSINGYT